VRYWMNARCPKNHGGDSEKLRTLESRATRLAPSAAKPISSSPTPAPSSNGARGVPLNVLALADLKVERATRGHRLHGRALRQRTRSALPEVDLVAGIGESLTASLPSTPVRFGRECCRSFTF